MPEGLPSQEKYEAFMRAENTDLETQADEGQRKPTLRDRLRYVLLGAGLVDENPLYKKEVEKAITDEHPVVPNSDQPQAVEHQPDEVVRMASEVYDRPMS